MKITGILLSMLLALTLMSTTATAGEKGGHMMERDGKMGDMPCSMMKKRHKMGHEMMGMLRETMSILKSIEHYPTDAQKKQLEKMIGRIDGMMSKHDSMMEKKKGMMDKKMDMKNMRMDKKMKKNEVTEE